MPHAAIQRKDLLAVAAVVALAIAFRLAVLPLAQTDGGDSVARVHIAWRWLDDPHIITSGFWQPFHFYLIAPMIAIFGDPVYAPIGLHVLFGVGSAALMFVFLRVENATTRIALLVALVFAIFPIEVRNSVSVRAETPFVTFLLAAMICTSLARRPGSSWPAAAAAGLFLTLGAGLRTEGWALIPVFMVMLWRRPAHAILLGAIASLHPLFWMGASYVSYGTPFFSISGASAWNTELMQMSGMSFDDRLANVLTFLDNIAGGLTWLVFASAIVGLFLAVAQRHRMAIWALPVACLTGLMVYAIMRGELHPKANYASSIGATLLPFAAVVFERLRMDRWSTMRYAAVSAVLLASVPVFACNPCWARVGFPQLGGVGPIPRIQHSAIVASVAADVRRHAVEDPDSGLVSDFFGWGETAYATLLTRLHPDRIFRASGTPGADTSLDDLVAFLAARPTGILLIRDHSRFNDLIERGDGDLARVGQVELALEPIDDIAWPRNMMELDSERNDPEGESTVLHVMRYAVTAGAGAEPAANAGRGRL